MKNKAFWQFKSIIQEHQSKNTSINVHQMPKTIKLVSPLVKEGEVWADIGGGRFDNVVAHFKTLKATLHVFDPFNRTQAHNDSVIQAIANGQCDGVMVNNVLNVIAEKENRKKVIEQAFDSLKTNAHAYFLVYEGNSSGQAQVTQKTKDSSSYQLNQKTEFYVEEIKAVFGEHVKRKGKFIVAEKKLQLNDDLENIKKAAKELGISRHGQVGKYIGGNLYVHKNYSDTLPKEELLNALVHLRTHLPQFEFHIIKYNKESKSFSFIQSFDFDTKEEPTVGDAILISADGEIKCTRAKKDPQIYHHKWVFVADDYQGFNIKQSIERSLAWKQELGINKEISSKIGTLSFWQQWLSSIGLSDKKSKIIKHN